MFICHKDRQRSSMGDISRTHARLIGVGMATKARFPLPELTARVDGWSVSITRQHGPSTRVVETGL